MRGAELRAHRRRRRATAAAAAAAAAALLVSGCATIPESGETGILVVDDTGEGFQSEIEPDGPEEGAMPADIVRGFLAAGSSHADDFAVARSFLTEDFAQEWEAQAKVTVMPSDASFDSFTANVSQDGQDISLAIPAAATLDAQHVYRQQPQGAEQDRDFTLRQVNGEWRISDAPHGLVVTSSSFSTLFDSYAVYFFTPDFEYLVPDTRWFIRSTTTATELMTELLAGPSERLRGAVASAVPDGMRLDSGSVTVEGGVAAVDLDSSAQGLEARDEERLVAQIMTTLVALSSTNSVAVSSPAGEMSAGDYDVPPVGVQTAQRPVVVSDGVLARLVDTRIEPIANLPDPPEDISQPAVSFDEQMYAYLAEDGAELHRVLAESGTDAVVLADEDGLTGPSFDRYGNLWTSHTSDPQHLSVVRPSGELTEVSVPWLVGREVRALGVSRDATQIAVLSAANGEAPRIDVAGIVRGEEGAPSGLVSETPLRVGGSFDTVEDFSWAGSAHLAVLGSAVGGEAQPHLVDVGGVSRELGEVDGGVSVTANSAAPSIRVTTAEGDLYSFGSDSWQRLVDLVAYDPAYPG